MNTPEFLLCHYYYNEPFYELFDSHNLEFYTLDGLLSFYRYLLNEGYIYEYQNQRFVKSSHGVFQVILVL